MYVSSRKGICTFYTESSNSSLHSISFYNTFFPQLIHLRVIKYFLIHCKLLPNKDFKNKSFSYLDFIFQFLTLTHSTTINHLSCMYWGYIFISIFPSDKYLIMKLVGKKPYACYVCQVLILVCCLPNDHFSLFPFFL